MKSKSVRDRDGFRKSERVVQTEKDALIFLSLLSSFYQLIVLEVGVIKRIICSVSEGLSQDYTATMLLQALREIIT